MINVILYAATTIDGFIATKDRNSDWVSDADNDTFIAQIKKAGCLIVGRLTFEQFKHEIYPIEGVTNIVITNSKPDPDEFRAEDLPKGTSVEYAIGPRECLELAKKLGHESSVLVGGAITNASFLKHNFINEVIVDVHPLILGDGLPMFNGLDASCNLKLVETETIENSLVLIKYKVIK